MPRLTIIAGPNGAGKTTLADKLDAEAFDLGHRIDPDRIARERGLNDFDAGRAALSAMRAHLAADESFAQETTLSSAQPVRWLDRAAARGFETAVIFVGVNRVETSIERVRDRVAAGGQDIPEDLQRQRFRRIPGHAAAAIRLADHATLYDNSGLVSQRVATLEHGRFTWLAEERPQWANALARALGYDPAPPNPKRLRDAIEGAAAAKRIFELTLDPVKGDFDAAHLREVNRRIFQDMPALGYADVTPGVYRREVPGWSKYRHLSGALQPHLVAYSRMDAAARQEIEATLKAARPEDFEARDPDDFARAMGELYTKLDFLHPFPDGNSRTLRAFTAQFAKAAGYRIDWAHFGASQQGRDLLYAARDIGVCRQAFNYYADSVSAREKIANSLARLRGVKDIPARLRDVVRPLARGR